MLRVGHAGVAALVYTAATANWLLTFHFLTLTSCRLALVEPSTALASPPPGGAAVSPRAPAHPARTTASTQESPRGAVGRHPGLPRFQAHMAVR